MPRLSQIQEASAPVLDDDTNWRVMGASSDGPENIQPGAVTRALSRASTLYYTSGMIHLIVETYVDYLLGEGTTVSAASPGATAFLQHTWETEVEENLEENIRELINSGELIWVVDRSMRLLPRVRTYARSRLQGLDAREDNLRRLAKLTLLDYNEKELIVPVYGSHLPEDDKVAVFLSLNRFGDNFRGMPLDTHLLDTAEIFDRSNIAMLARLPGLYAIWWDVTLKGYTEGRVRDWEKNFGGSIPEPGSIVAHNDAAEYEIKSASGAGSTSSDWSSYYRDLLLVEGGVSPMLFEGMSYRYPESSNPTFRRFKRLRQKLSRFFGQVAELILEGGGYKEKSKVSMIDHVTPDLLRIASATDKVTAMLVAGTSKGWIDQDKAKEIFGTMVAVLSMPTSGIDKKVQ